MFHPVESSVSFPKLEEAIGRFWKDRGIYERSLAARAHAPAFVFYEGPPTANGLPHPGHCLTRAIKDLFPRYRTMRGFRCLRKAGWDTHGLPVEVEVCKELGIHAKDEIEAYGVEPFIHKCVESVFRYTREWEQLTERLGFWIELDDAYVTYHQSYVESVWWALKNLFDRGLLYQGHKIVWWWPQGGTALSAGEVGQGYRQVADPSVYVKFPLLDDAGNVTDTSLLVWTTTPWTLPSNQFAAVKPELEYSVVSFEGEPGKLVVASALVAEIAKKTGREHRVLDTLPGQQLVGLRYVPPFDYYRKDWEGVSGVPKGGSPHDLQVLFWRVVAADFVTVDTGTGVVHQAPAFGEVDYDVLLAERARFPHPAIQGLDMFCPVAPDGTFTDRVSDYQGRCVKDCDRDIIRQLKAEGKLFHQEQYLHDYPFCWRAQDDPLIQYPRKSWFIRTTQFKNQMLANNRQIAWLPEHIRDGRFGNFLETNVDWALSRERYWGTPLPIWVCDECGCTEAVASYENLLAKPDLQGTEVWEDAKRAHPGLSEHLKVHKPYIDAITYDCPRNPGARMRRVPEVIDCWFDSGAMPFAQWGYPHEPGSAEKLSDQFPADFISEALDQTRGWFYSLLAISTLLFGKDPSEPGRDDSGSFFDSSAPTVGYPHPYRNCVVLGLILGEDGEKMSKSKRNYREPQEIFDRYGADAMRWYFLANQPPWTTIRYSEAAIKESIPEFLLRLWNVYSFFVIYAGIDRFDPGAAIPGDAGQLTASVLATAEGYRPPAERSELDRWILSELSRTAADVVRAMDAYDAFTACGRLTEFVDALSNWYVRRSRDRFWAGGSSADKSDAYWTLYECLLTASKLIAPFVPFLAEELWQKLAVEAFPDSETGQARVAESVHLCDYPDSSEACVDETLSRQMALVREIVSLGRSARMGAKLKVRQPIARVEVVLVDPAHEAWLEEHAGLIREELNAKRVEVIRRAEQYITYTVLPDLKRLGPRLGRRLPELRKTLAESDAGRLLAALEAEGQCTLTVAGEPVVLTAEDLQVRLQAKEGWAAAQGRLAVVVISTELTPELIAEGLAREVVHAVQNARKDMGLQYTDRIRIVAVTPSESLHAAIGSFREYVEQETLTVELECLLVPGDSPGKAGQQGHRFDVALAGQPLVLYLQVSPSGRRTA